MTRPMILMTAVLFSGLIAAPACRRECGKAPAFSPAAAYSRMPVAVEAGRSSAVVIGRHKAAFVASESDLSHTDRNGDGYYPLNFRTFYGIRPFSRT